MGKKWEDLSPQEKADMFDQQDNMSSASAERKRESREYPYDLEPEED